MSERWPGSLISPTAPVPSGGGAQDSAPGVWTLDQAAPYIATNNWPGLGTPDPQFQYVSALLHGDGTNGAQNNTFLDSSSNNFTITRNGNITQGSFSPYGPLWSNYFNGSNQYITSPSSSAYTLGSSGDFTIDGWFYMTSDGGGIYPIITNYNNWDTGYSNRFYIGFSGNVFRWYGSGGSTAISTSSYSLNKWNYFNFTRSGSTITGYLNGNIIGTQTTSQDYTTDDALRIAGSMGNGNYFNGYVSNVRIIKGATVSGTTVPTAPATAVSGTTFLSCQSNRFIDNSSNNFTLTAGNSPSVQRFSPLQNLATYQTAKIGGSAYANDNGYLSSTGSLGSIGTGDFTVECWVYPTTYTYSNIVLNIADDQTTTGISFYTYQNTLRVYSATGYLSYSGALNLNSWNHVAWVRQSGVITAYLNGVSVGSGNYANNISSSGFRVGGELNSGTLYNGLQGYMTDVRLVNSAIYTTTFTPPTAPLTAVSGTQLLTNFTNGAIYDNAEMNDLETVGDAQISTSVVKYGTGSLKFDGSGDYLLGQVNQNQAFGTGNFTIEFWMYPTATTDCYVVANLNGSGASPNNSWGLYLTSGQIPQFTTYFSVLITGSQAVPLNTWSHFAITRAGSTMMLFLNGNMIGSASNSTDFSSTNALRVGAHSSGTSPYTGYVDDLRITKGYCRYWYNFVPPSAPYPNYGGTVALLTYDPQFNSNTLLLNGDIVNGNTSTFIADASTNNFVVSPNGSPSNAPQNPFQAGYYSNYFNGSNYLSIGSSNAVLPTGTQDFCVELWANFGTQTASYPQLVTNPVNNGFQIYYGGGLLGIGRYNIANVVAYTTPISTFTNSWNHIVATRSGNTFRLFVNGVLQANGVDSSSFAALGTQYIGSDVTTNPFVGYISNVRTTLGSIPTTYQTSSTTNGATIFTSPTSPLSTTSQGASNPALLTCQSNSFIDNSANAFAITATGSPTVSQNQPFTYTAPTTYASGYFNGSSYLLTPSSASISNFSGDFTIEGWVYLNSATSYAVLIGGDGSNGWYIEYSSNRGFGAYDGSSFKGGSSSAVTGQWVHYAVTRASGTLRFFINGANTATTTSSGFNYTQALGISAYSGGSSFINGYQSNIRINNTTALYTSAFTPSTTPFTAVSGTQLLTVQNNVPATNSGFLDSSSNAFAITRNGNTTQGSFSPYGSLWGNYFNGSSWLLSTSSQVIPTGSFTVEGWLYPTSNVQQYAINQGTSGGTGRFAIGMLGGYWYAQLDAVNVNAIPVVLNQWTYIAVTYNGSTLTLYVNGTSAGTASPSNGAQNTTLRLGGLGSDWGTGYEWNGYVSNVRISNTVRTISTPSTSPLTADGNTVFLGCQANRFKDSSSNNYALTVGGGSPQVQRFSPFNPTSTYSTSVIGGSGYFDGSSYLTLSPGSAFAFGTGDFTVEAWIYMTSTPYYAYIIDARNSGQTNTWSFDFGYDGTVNKLSFGTSGTFYIQEPTASAVQLNCWNHVAYTRTGTTGSLYCNGVRLATGTDNNDYNVSPTTSYVGVRYSGTGNPQVVFNGYMSTRVINGTAIYTGSSYAVPTTPFTAITNTSLLLNGTNAGIPDLAMQNDLQTVGSAQVSTTQYKYGTSSIYFNGSGSNLFSPYAPQLNISSGDFTIECWVYYTTATSYFHIASMWDSGKLMYQLLINTGSAYVDFNTSSNGSSSTGDLQSANNSIPANTWTHVAVSRNSGTNYLFINGNLQTTNTATIYNGTSNLAIGGRADGSFYGTGYIDDLRITKGLARYVQNFTPPTAAFPTY